MTEQEISINAALAIVLSPDPFFPEPMRQLAREKIKADGNEEQKKMLNKEPSVRKVQTERLSAMNNTTGGRLSNFI